MLELLKRSQFEEMYAIMELSFPDSERRSREDQAALFEDDRYRVTVLRDDEGRVCAFMAWWQLESCTYLEHFAVGSALRGHGLGGRFLDELTAALRAPVVLEVELPQTDIAARRIAFYERHGFALNGYDYIQPPLGKGKEPLPLRIMSLGDKLTPEQFGAIRADIYAAVYKVSAQKI